VGSETAFSLFDGVIDRCMRKPWTIYSSATKIDRFFITLLLSFENLVEDKIKSVM
jgi:hypothetical protein